jgi:2-polyprenyl-3-methyl-5-hydroxy-6-metoxy-1,4-benzoquinol methylase
MNIRQSLYALGHSERELNRLTRQAQAFEPLTRRLLIDAGIDSGMRVLDVGCGSGDLAFLAADLVGSNGEVIGVDRSAIAVEWAGTRARAFGIKNATFLKSEVDEIQCDRPFDAVVGRLVLMYCPDPVNTIRKVTALWHDGGVVVFQEIDAENCRSFPSAASYDRAASWIKKALAASGARLQLGLELFGLFVAAGLPGPSLRMDALIGGGPECSAYQLIADVVETLLPTIEKHKIATAADVEVSTLARRMRDEVVERNGVALSPGLIGAWSRKRPTLVSDPLASKSEVVSR